MPDGFDFRKGVDWETLTPDERNRALFAKQKALLDTFLSTGAIDRRQYTKSLTCLAEKMGIDLEADARTD